MMDNAEIEHHLNILEKQKTELEDYFTQGFKVMIDYCDLLRGITTRLEEENIYLHQQVKKFNSLLEKRKEREAIEKVDSV